MNLMWGLLGIFNYRLSENLQVCERLKWLKSSPLMKSELKHLCECLTTSQPKHLFYIHILIEELSPELPTHLQDNMLGNLQSLVIECCSIIESKLKAILPALNICFQLIATVRMKTS